MFESLLAGFMDFRRADSHGRVCREVWEQHKKCPFPAVPLSLAHSWRIAADDSWGWGRSATQFMVSVSLLDTIKRTWNSMVGSTGKQSSPVTASWMVGLFQPGCSSKDQMGDPIWITAILPAHLSSRGVAAPNHCTVVNTNPINGFLWQPALILKGILPCKRVCYGKLKAFGCGMTWIKEKAPSFSFITARRWSVTHLDLNFPLPTEQCLLNQ